MRLRVESLLVREVSNDCSHMLSLDHESVINEC
jgi:hypothetical protein